MSVQDCSAYVPRHASTSHFTKIRGVSYHFREWGRHGAPPLLLLHGIRDSSVSFQFLVDVLESEWHILAPDWRGHGLSGWTPGSYWLADFLCDLDALVSDLFAGCAVTLVGHSMGGNIASAYSGLRPKRVSRLMMLDVLGNLLDQSPVHAAEMLIRLLDAERAPETVHSHPDVAELVQRLMARSRHLEPARARFLAEANSHPLAAGGLAWRYDPTLRRSWPSLHSTEEWADCWRRIEASVLCLIASDPRRNAPTSHHDVVLERTRHFRDVTVRTVPETGHNLHQEAPEFVARALEEFARRE
jgi:pimeloyl-ACP methyl ester carboxylesterase